MKIPALVVNCCGIYCNCLHVTARSWRAARLPAPAYGVMEKTTPSRFAMSWVVGCFIC